MTISYLHPGHLAVCLQPGDFIFCTLAVLQQSKLELKLQDRFYAADRMPEEHASDTRVMVVSALPDGSVDYDEVIEACHELMQAGHNCRAFAVRLGNELAARRVLGTVLGTVP